MTDERTTPLRPRDPRALGRYEIVARLGEGGMGTVYLARNADGDLVAVKVIRADLAPDDEFRRRFRSEVNRVRQVPPFCTAEVLDADPDHEQPYLVVEYVDGPSLADVVEERGPLKASSLHGVAIGVATALTAIHGAGVIHRDLKPRNVLLPPGSPKVIDFGIARALEATSAHTETDQMVGTVAYMAPERFGSTAGALLTPAADVFAWGGVVAYAGMGRTPFKADSPTATAARILTQPPDLSGLSGSLRDLVAHALEKDPANRPTARELLDLLVAVPGRPAATAAALAHQPVLWAAAQDAQDVTGYHEMRRRTAAAASTRIGYDEESIVTQPVPAPPIPVSPAVPSVEPASAPRRRWVLPSAVAMLIVAVVAGIAMVGAAWPSSGAPGVADTPPPGTTGADDKLLVTDPLRGVRLWQETTVASERASCSFDDALVVRRETRGSFRCQGPQDAEPADVRAEVRVRLLTRNSCAAIWFRFRSFAGYQVRVCENNIYVGTHKNSQVLVYKTFPLDDNPIGVGAPPTTIALTVAGPSVQVFRDGALIGTVPLVDKGLTGGSVVLGLYTERNAPEQGPYAVAFNDVKIWRIG
jgi:eukaryotic-like serine/threonine-protein kinase